MGTGKADASTQDAEGEGKIWSEARDAEDVEEGTKEEVAELAEKMKKAKDLQERTLSAYDDLDRAVRQVLLLSWADSHLAMDQAHMTHRTCMHIRCQVPYSCSYSLDLGACRSRRVYLFSLVICFQVA